MPFWQLFPFDERKNTHFGSCWKLLLSFQRQTKWLFVSRTRVCFVGIFSTRIRMHQLVPLATIVRFDFRRRARLFNFSDNQKPDTFAFASRRHFCDMKISRQTISHDALCSVFVHGREQFLRLRQMHTNKSVIVWTLHKGEKSFYSTQLSLDCAAISNDARTHQ